MTEERLKHEEIIARDHLRSQGYQQVRSHPDGLHNPPDLLVDGAIAVEVRRLNQNERGLDTPKGLEEESIPFIHRVNTLLAAFGDDGPTRWHVGVEFRRPLPKRDRLQGLLGRLRCLLQDLLDQSQPPEKVGMEMGNVRVEVVRRPQSGRPTFTLGSRDADFGPWLMEEYERNLRLCIAEKANSVAAHRSRYRDWWLVLVDYIGFHLSEESRKDFRASVSVDRHDWQRIILVNPLDHRQHFEV